ncbi:hypothetical protein D9M68_816180 [compost metagenome]
MQASACTPFNLHTEEISTGPFGEYSSGSDNKTSLKVRKRIEEAFGWIKTVGGLAKTKLIGQAELTGQALLCFATFNLVRMGSLGGWWDAHHA